MDLLAVESKYEPLYSVDRIRALQNLCSPVVQPGKYQSLLIIGGADGNHLNLAQAILKYLFLGATGQDLLGTQVIGDKQQVLDETILLIEYSQISILYATDARPYLLPYISTWHNVREYCISIPSTSKIDTVSNAANDWEENKIEAFAQMVAHLHSCGIPLQMEKGQTCQMAAEMIPIIQAYGIDQTHVQRGFFTMKHVILDASNDLKKIIAFDMYASKRLTSYAEPLLRDHFLRFLSSMDLLTHSERITKSELELAETLFMYYEFGSLNFAAKNIFVTEKQGTKCLIGVHTLDDLAKSLNTATIENQGCANFPTTHFLIQAEDPATSLRAIRTYFLGCGKIAPNISELDTTVPRVDPKLEQYKNISTNAADISFLSALYRLLMKISQLVTEQLPLWLTDARDVNSLLKGITNRTKEYIKQNYTSFVTDAMKFWESQIQWHINVDVMFFDAAGQIMPEGAVNDLFNEIFSSKQIHKYSHMSLEFCIHEIPSQCAPSKILGSVKLGDSYLVRWKKELVGSTSAGNMANIFTAALATSTANATVFNITQGIPYYRTWLQDGKELDFANHLNNSLKSEYWANILQLGRSLGDPLSHAFLITSSSEWPYCQGSLYGFSNGFAFVTPYFPPLVVSFANNILDMSYVTLNVTGASLCCFTLKKESNPLTSVWQFTPSDVTIGIPFFQQLSNQQKILLDYLGQWKIAANSHHVPILLKDQQDLHMEKNTFNLAAFSKVCHYISFVYGGINNGMYLVYKETTRSLYPSLPLPHRHAVFETSWSSRTKVGTKQNPLQAVVLMGIHGSNVKVVADQIQNLSSANNTWFSLDLNIGAIKSKSNYDIYHSLYTILKQTTETISLSTSSFSKRPRLMIILQGYFDPLLLLLCFYKPLYPYPLELKLTSVTTVINSVNIYQPILSVDQSTKELQDSNSAFQTLFPFFMNQIQYPFTDNIILVYSNLLSDKESASLRYRLHQANPIADVLCLHNSIFDRSTDSLLLKESDDKVALLSTSDVHQLWMETVTLDDIKNSKYMQQSVMTESVSIRFKATGVFLKESVVGFFLKSLFPNAIFNNMISQETNEEIEQTSEQMKGLRLAQHLAKEKVIKKNSPLQEIAPSPKKNNGCIWACTIDNLRLKDLPGLYTFLAVNKRAWIYSADKQEETEDTIFEFTGTQLNKNDLKEIILACRQGAVSELTKEQSKPKEITTSDKTSLRSRITREELEILQKQHISDPLPNDIFFDGRQYISMSGETYEYHPNMDKFIEEYLKTKEKTVKEIQQRQNKVEIIQTSVQKDSIIEI